MKYLAAILLLVCAAANVSGAQAKQLFYIERNKNANILQYEANLLPDGRIDPEQPVIAYWVMLARDGHTEKLNFLDKRAYGFDYRFEKQTGVCELVINAFKKRVLKICNGNDAFMAETTINNKPAYLKKVYITAKDAIPLPRVESIELFGINKEDNMPLYEKIKI